MKSDLQKAVKLLDTAEAKFREEGDIPGLTLVLVRRAYVYREVGNYKASLKDAEETLNLVGRRGDLQSNYAEALRIKGNNLIHLGQTRQGVVCLKHSLRIYSDLKESGSTARLMNATGSALYYVGDVKSAEIYYQNILKNWETEKNLFLQASVLNNLGVLYHRMGDYELAAKTFEKGLLCARRGHNLSCEALLLLSLGDLYTEIEDFECAEIYYHSVNPLIKQFPSSFIETYLILARANLALLSGDTYHAQRIINNSLKQLKRGQSLYVNGLQNLLEGRLFIHTNQPELAIPIFEDSKSFFISDGRKIEELLSRLWLAVAKYEIGENNSANQEMREIIQNASPFEHYFGVIARQARKWLFVSSRDSEVKKVTRDLRARVVHLDSQITQTRRQLRHTVRMMETQVPRIDIRALDDMQVKIDGRQIGMADWQTHSVRELFYYLVAAGKPLTKEQIGEILWPDTDEPSKLNLRFKNDMYRLRRVVGRDTIIYENEYYKFNHSLDYEYDVEAFDGYLTKARDSHDDAEQIWLYQKAIDLFHRPYLESIGASWVLSERERLGQAYLLGSLSLAELYQRVGQESKALSKCQRALEYDPTFEPLYRLLMKIYHGMGDRSSVARTFENCKKAMLEIIELPPSAETQKLYQDLIV